MSVSRRSFLASGAGAAVAVTLTGLAGPAAAHGPAVRPSTALPSGAWQSDLVKVTGNGLRYPRRDGLRIPDFGHSGYHQGERPLPDVPVARTISPVVGDNTAHIQEAVDVVGALNPDRNGFRGAVLLQAGTYEVAGTLLVRHSGVVLRGVGDGDDPATSTIIRAVGNTPSSRDVMIVGGNVTGWGQEVPGTRTDIISGTVQVGDSSFAVADGSRLKVGDNIIITHPCTQEWIDAVDGGGTADDPPWRPGFRPIVYNRYVTAVRDNRVTVDVPLFNTLDRSLAQSYVYVWDREHLVTEVGVEDLRVDIAFDASKRDPDGAYIDEEHAYNGIRLENAQDAWVRRCTVLHFEQAGIVTRSTTRATISDCRSIDPVSVVTGGRRYNFNADPRSQQVLFVDCHANDARHAFVANGNSSVSGVVFLRTTAEGSYTSSEGHRQWVQGLLFDNHTEIAPRTDRTIGLYSRGDYGTGHGWSAAHSVAWNTDAVTKLVVQQPPTAQNYAIGCLGEITGDGPFEGAVGHIEGAGRSGLYPESLYEAQLADRLR